MFAANVALQCVMSRYTTGIMPGGGTKVTRRRRELGVLCELNPADSATGQSHFPIVASPIQ